MAAPSLSGRGSPLACLWRPNGRAVAFRTRVPPGNACREARHFQTAGSPRDGDNRTVMDHDPFRLDRSRASVRFAVRLVPRAGLDRVDGVSAEGTLKVRVAAPAIDGLANAALLRVLAHDLNVPRTSVRIIAGATGRQKLILVDGVSPEGVSHRWPGIKV